MRVPILFALLLLLAVCSIGQTPAAIEASLSSYLDNIAKYGSYGGGYDEDKLSKNSALIKTTLVKNGARADILRYGFPNLTDKMFIATSPDRRFRVYSWDLEDGGSMHDFDHVIQYVGKSGKISLWEAPPNDGGGGYYTDIFQVGSAAGTIYLTVSTGVGSNVIQSQSIEAYMVDGDNLFDKAKVIKTNNGLTNSIGFVYDRGDLPERLVTWNATDKSFKFPVVIEDEKNPDGRVTNRFITYRFNGKYFVKVS